MAILASPPELMYQHAQMLTQYPWQFKTWHVENKHILGNSFTKTSFPADDMVVKAYAHLGHVANNNAPTGLGFRKAKKCQDYSLKNHEETYATDEY